MLNGSNWQTLHAMNDQQYFAPASNTKVGASGVLCRVPAANHPCPPQLLTTSAAFHALGPDHVFTTQLQVMLHTHM